MWVFKNKYFHMVSGWVDGVWIRALPIGCCVDGQLYTQRQAVSRRRRGLAIEFTICCDIFTIMGRRLHYIKYNKIRHKNNGVSRFKSIRHVLLLFPVTATTRQVAVNL